VAEHCRGGQRQGGKTYRRYLKLVALYNRSDIAPVLLEDLNDLTDWQVAGGVPPAPAWVEWMIERRSEESINSML